ncbi:MAG: (2Fe-2S) ferredoxin domain-containing protein [Planctomycetota bacterium]
MAKFQRHMFVCVHDRGPGHPRGSCAQRGSVEVAEALKAAVHARGLKRIVRVNKSGCLDQCSRGVTCVIYPEGVWYGGVGTADVEEIVDRHLIGGEAIERLRIPDDELTGRDPDEGAPV